jgi:ectonucleotide pyrophosphatase/phosphodiesterase family member 5
MFNMYPSTKLTLLWALLASCVNICITHEEVEEVPRLLLISFDGFRWDYLNIMRERGIATPTFERLISEGVSIRSPGLTNAFATKTIPDHYTLVTGLYEEDHGIIANDFYDPVFNETFNIHNTATATDIKWWNGTSYRRVSPIWVTNEHENPQHRASGIYMWPGSEVKQQQPTYFKTFNNSVPFKERADKIVSWFTDVKRPINFGALYMPEPDGTGHAHGPMSTEVANKIAELDENMKYLLEKLEQVKLLHGLNIIFTSDHGMEDVNKTIYLSDFVNSSLYVSHGGTPVKHIWPKPG